MLGKLMKHDFHSLSRTLVPANIAIFGATLLASIALTLNIRFGFSAFDGNFFFSIFQVISIILMAVMFIAIFAASFFIMFVIFQRFYKNFMSSEGYLTFTLPVKTSDLLWSKLITAVLWMIITGIVGMISLFVFLLIGTGDSGIVNMEVLDVLGRGLRQLAAVYTGGITVIILEVLLFILVASVHTIMQVYLALVIGGTVSQKHKVAAGVGFYFAINMVTGTISSLIQIPFLNSFGNSMVGTYESGYFYSVQESINSFVAAMQPYYWIMVGTSVLYSVVFFVLSHYFLKNKLNLE